MSVKYKQSISAYIDKGVYKGLERYSTLYGLSMSAVVNRLLKLAMDTNLIEHYFNDRKWSVNKHAI